MTPPELFALVRAYPRLSEIETSRGPVAHWSLLTSIPKNPASRNAYEQGAPGKPEGDDLIAAYLMAHIIDIMDVADIWAAATGRREFAGFLTLRLGRKLNRVFLAEDFCAYLRVACLA